LLRQDRVADAPATNEPECERRQRWHQRVIADLELNGSALRFAALVAHDNTQTRYLHISIRQAAAQLGISRSTLQDGCNQLIARKWLIQTAIGTFGLGRGAAGAPATPLGNDNDNG
jgi:AraC-like DNA-binding protein